MSSSNCCFLTCIQVSQEAGEREEWKSCLETKHSKTKIIASNPITSRQIDEKNWKQWQILLSWAPKSLQIVSAAMKLRHLPLGRKAMRNLDSIFKSRDITLPTEVCIVKVMVFPVVMYRRKSWTYVGQRSLVWYSPRDCQESDRTQQVDNKKHTVRSLNRIDNRQK